MKLAKASGCCSKCRREDGLHNHHIIAQMDGGSDEPQNISSLCGVCHAEWHTVERWVDFISYEDWLKVPPIHILITDWSIKHPGAVKLVICGVEVEGANALTASSSDQPD